MIRIGKFSKKKGILFLTGFEKLSGMMIKGLEFFVVLKTQ